MPRKTAAPPRSRKLLPDISFEAAFLRAALLLGVVREQEVPDWAESLLLVQADDHGLLSDVIMAPVELTAMRDALQPLADEADPTAVCASVLTFLAEDTTSRELSVHDAVRVFTLMRTEFRIAPEGAWSAKRIEDRLMLAEGGVKNAVAPTRAEIDAWLGGVRGPAHFRISFTASDEAGAFLGALARRVERERRAGDDDPVAASRVWMMPRETASPVTLLLNEAASYIVRREFAPVSIGSRIPYAAVPEHAALTLDGSARELQISSETALGLRF